MFTHPSTTDSVQVPNHRLTKKRDVVAYKNRAFSAVKKPLFLVNRKRGCFLGNQKKRQFGCTNLYLIIRISACMQASRRLFVCLTTRPAESRPAALRKSAWLTKNVKKSERILSEKSKRSRSEKSASFVHELNTIIGF